MTEVFFDTNVALYLLSADWKADRAETLVRSGGVVSAQVLTEFADVARRKFKLTFAEVREALSLVRRNLEVVPVTAETHDLAIAIADRHRFRIYDSQLLAAAVLAGCRTFYSEDLHDGQVIEGALTIRNPFA